MSSIPYFLFSPFYFKDLSQIPFLGERVMELSKLLPNARPGDSEMSIPPLFIPKAPERNYFLFGEVTPMILIVSFRK